MGKKVSWFNSVKKVFRSSSSKDNEKKKATPHRWQTDAPEPVLPTHFPSQSSPRRAFAGDTTPLPVVAVDEGRIRAVAVAMATAAAAAEVDRLATVGRQSRGDQAAILIQSVYRGYLARRALRALKGLVRLQALVRGHNVRKQAQVTMRCMQALVRVQARVRARRVLIAQQKNSNKFEHVQGDHYVDHDDGDGDGDYDDDGIDDYPPSLEVDSWDGRHHRREGVRRKTFHRKHNAVIEREKELAYAYAQQPWHPESSYGENFSAADSGKTQWGWNWLDSWISSRPYDARHVAPDGSYFTATHTDDMSEKTVEMDIARSASYVDAGNQRNPVKNFRRPPGLSPEREVSSSHVSAGKDIPAVRVVVPTPSYMATTHSSMAKARADVPHRHAPSLAYTCKRPPKRVGSTGDSSSSGGGSGSGVLGSQMQQRSSSTKGVGGIRVRTHGFTGYNADSSGGEERTPPSSGTDHRKDFR